MWTESDSRVVPMAPAAVSRKTSVSAPYTHVGFMSADSPPVGPPNANAGGDGGVVDVPRPELLGEAHRQLVDDVAAADLPVGDDVVAPLVGGVRQGVLRQRRGLEDVRLGRRAGRGDAALEELRPHVRGVVVGELALPVRRRGGRPRERRQDGVERADIHVGPFELRVEADGAPIGQHLRRPGVRRERRLVPDLELAEPLQAAD